jgi:branched-chain amino acid transport system permease protein
MYYVELLAVGIVWGCSYALMALGLALVYGLLRILHVAQATVFTLGAYVGVLVANHFGSLAPAFFFAAVAAGLLGPAIYRWAYQPILDQPRYVVLVASIGIVIAMEDGFRLIFGPYGESFSINSTIFNTHAVAGLTMSGVQIAVVVTSLVLLAALGTLAWRTRVGIAWRASVSDPAMASSCGINLIGMRYLCFLIASILAGLSGVLIALLNGLVEPGMGSVIAYKGLAIIVLGGLGNVRGTLVASIVLGIVESFGSVFLNSTLDRDAIAFLCVIVALLVRPEGLFGTAR